MSYAILTQRMINYVIASTFVHPVGLIGLWTYRNVESVNKTIQATSI